MTAATGDGAHGSTTEDSATTTTTEASTEDDGRRLQQRPGHRRPGRRPAGPRARRSRAGAHPRVHPDVRLARALLGVAVAAFLVALTGGPAAAHASLLSSDPSENAVVATDPRPDRAHLQRASPPGHRRRPRLPCRRLRLGRLGRGHRQPSRHHPRRGPRNRHRPAGLEGHLRRRTHRQLSAHLLHRCRSHQVVGNRVRNRLPPQWTRCGGWRWECWPPASSALPARCSAARSSLQRCSGTWCWPALSCSSPWNASTPQGCRSGTCWTGSPGSTAWPAPHPAAGGGVVLAALLVTTRTRRAMAAVLAAGSLAAVITFTVTGSSAEPWPFLGHRHHSGPTTYTAALGTEGNVAIVVHPASGRRSAWT